MPLSSVSYDFGRGRAPGGANTLGAIDFRTRPGGDRFTSSLMTLDAVEQQRLRRYTEHWNFYYGKQWAFLRSDGESLITLNYFRKMVDKSVSFLMGKYFTINVPQALERVTLPFLERVWKENNGPDLLFQIGTVGSVSGDAFLLFTVEEPSEVQRRINPFAKPRIRINLLSSEWVFPVWETNDSTKMVSCRVETIVQRPNIFQTNLGRPETAPTYSRQTQIFTPDAIIRYEETSRNGRNDWLRGEEFVVPNSLGEIPIVHIKNISLPGENYGIPDGQDLISLQRELNEKSTDVSDTVHYHASPVTVLEGVRVKQIEKSPKKIWSVPKGAKVYNLEYGGDMELTHRYLELIKKCMHEVSDVPEKALGGDMAISNTSGVALSMMLRPLIEKTDKKKASYGPGLERANYFLLRLGILTNQLYLPFDLCEACGGRIVERVIDLPDMVDITGAPATRTESQCYAIDPKTLEFMDPANVKVKLARTVMGGTRIIETEFWRYVSQYRQVEKSFWQDEAGDLPDGQTEVPTQAGADGVPVPAAPPPPPELYRTRLLEVPLEPEEVTVQVRTRNLLTGEDRVSRTEKRMLIPTGCTVHQYLNPFTNDVIFGDPLPRDEKLEADKLQQYLAMKIVSKEFVQRQIPVIAKEMTQINKELEQEKQTATTSGPVAPPTPIKQPELKSREDIDDEQEKGRQRREAKGQYDDEKKGLE